MRDGDRDDEVRRLAYRLWELAGRPCGLEHEFWAEASRTVEGTQERRDLPPRHVAR